MFIDYSLSKHECSVNVTIELTITLEFIIGFKQRLIYVLKKALFVMN